MATPTSAPPQVVRFGPFELDPQAGELRRNGRKVRLDGQPFTILVMLLERPGQVVTREEVKQKLWPADTFVDFEHSINVAVQRLREALQDSASAPRFIETLPRRGYRFIYPVGGDEAAQVAAPPRRRWVWPALLVATAVLVAAVLGNIAGIRDRLTGRGTSPPSAIKRIAVLPLRDLSGDPEQRYLAAGFTEMVITELGRLRGVEVVSHQSVLRYAQTEKSLQEIARELQVDAVIEGTVLRSGERVRVTINFVQARPERHLLAQSFEHELRDVLRVQRDVGAAVSRQIRPRVPAAAAERPLPRTVAIEVTEAYLRGQAQCASMKSARFVAGIARPVSGSRAGRTSRLAVSFVIPRGSMLLRSKMTCFNRLAS